MDSPFRKRKKKRAPSPGVPLTFRLIDEARGYFLEGQLPQEWALEIWFASLYDTPIDAFDEFNLARCCRQHRTLEPYRSIIVPRCLDFLKNAPLYWFQGDGELLFALIGLPSEYWSAHPREYEAVVNWAKYLLEKWEGDDHARQQILHFLTSEQPN